MKIISKHKDYYDGVQAYGVDNNIIYKRFTETVTISIQAKHQGISQLIKKISRIPDIDIDDTHTFKLKESIVGFCGKIYPTVSFIEYKNKEFIKQVSFYDEESTLKFIRKLNEKYPKLKYYMSYEQYIEDDLNNDIEKIFNDDIVKNDFSDLFQLVNAPVFEIDCVSSNFNWEYNTRLSRPTEIQVNVNCRLKDYSFYKVIDSSLCYQKISQFLSGVLTSTETYADNLNDKQKIYQHGFDAKYGFRNRPKK